VDGQIYRELMVYGRLKAPIALSSVSISPPMQASATTRSTIQVQITARMRAGGDSFVISGLAVSPWLYSAGRWPHGTETIWISAFVMASRPVRPDSEPDRFRCFSRSGI